MQKHFTARNALFLFPLLFLFYFSQAQTLGNISPSTQTIFSGSNPSTITLSGPDVSGVTFQWTRSSNGTDFYFISGATNYYYTPPGPETQTWYYKVVLTNTTSHATSYSPVASVIIKNHLAAGTTSPSAVTINYNSLPGQLTNTGATGGIGSYQYQWQQSNDNSTYTDISGATAQNYSPGNLTATTYFRQKVVCGSETGYSNVVTVTVYPQLTGGSISPSSQTINYNATAGALTAGAVNGGNGTYSYQWQSSPNTTTWNNISGATGTSYSPGLLSVSTYYRLTVLSNGATLVSNTATVNVYPQLTAGSISPASQTINYNTATTLTAAVPTGGSGSYSYQWQSSANGTSWSNISGATSLSFTTGSLTANTYYRMVYSSNGASVSSATATVSVYPQLLCAVTGGVAAINYNTSPGLLDNTPSGGNGSYTYLWQQSADNINWTSTGITTQDYTPGALTANRWYRVITTSNGVSANSNVIAVTVYPQLIAGTLTPTSADVAYNTSPGLISGSLPTGGNGSYSYQWQNSIDNGSTWTTISGATAQNYTPDVLSANTRFRRSVSSNGVTVYTAAAIFTVYPTLVVPSIVNNVFEVYFYGDYTISVSPAIGGTGTYNYQWQSSADSVNWTNISGATSLDYIPAALTSTTFIRMKVISGSFTAYSNTVKAIMPLNGGTIAVNAAVINSGGGITLSSIQNASGSSCSSYAYQWQSSPDGFTWTNIPGINVTGITADTWFRRLAVCGSYTIASNSVLVRVINTAAAFTPNTETAPLAGTQPEAGIPSNYTGYDANNINYIKTRVITKPGVTSQVASDALAAATDVQEATEYFDGLGRSIQKVEKQATPNQKDWISVKYYDAFGREPQQYLPYTDSLSTGTFRTNPAVKQPAFYNSLLAGQEAYFYTNTFFETSPLDKILEKTAPGKSWTGRRKGARTIERANTVYDSVVCWKISIDSASLPYKVGYYVPGSLIVREMIDENGNQSLQYIDREGNRLMKKDRLSDQVTSGFTGWAASFYIYDDLGRLRFVLPPKATEGVKSNWVISSAVASELCYQYRYDFRSRMIVKKSPGADSTETVYDKRNRVIATRDGNLKSLGYWQLNYYDGQNRETLNGLCVLSLNRAQLADSVSRFAYNPLNPFPFIDTTSINKQNYTYYDTYDYNGAQPYTSTDISKPSAGSNLYSEALPATNSKLTRGAVTGLRQEVDYDGQYLMTTKFLDDKGRVIQVAAENTQGGKDVTSSMYDFNGKLLSTYLKHTNPKSTATPQFTLLTMNDYDAGGRLDSIKARINDNLNLQQTLSVRSYDELGQLISRKLGVTTAPLETLNYDYNIRGWMRGINRQYVNSASNTSNWFGQELCYDFGFDSRQYNGNISGVKWKSGGDRIARSYGFNYDNLNRLLQGNFNQQNTGSTSWTKDKVDFSVSGLSYDMNGNVLFMKQVGMNGIARQTIDSLKYGYIANSNRLSFVTDKKNNPQSTLGDFKEIDTTETADYTYTPGGSLMSDRNKNIDSIWYNHTNRISILQVKNRGRIYYQYKGGEEKVSKLVSDSVGPKFKWTHYIGNLVYDAGADNIDTLKYIFTDEGRIRPVYKSGQPVGFTFDYFIRDHLGNVRMVLGTKSDTATYAATMETAASAVENALFNNIDNTRADKPVGYPTDNTTSPNNKVALLNGANGQKIGPSLVLRVMAGDSIAIVCKALYKDAGATTSGNTSSSMVSAIIQAFSSSGVSDGVHGSTGVNSPISLFTSALYDGLKTQDSTQNLSTQPKAYLNFAAFDDQFNLVSENSGVRQVKGTVDSLIPLIVNKMVIKKTGFIYIYESNESAKDVYFDNLIVTHNTGPVLEETHYYPFGLTMAGISNKALKGQLYPENNRKYNGIEFNDEFDLDQYDANYRTLDPQIGRWGQIDPKVDEMEAWSPYASNYDNPIKFSDILGDEPIGPGVMGQIGPIPIPVAEGAAQAVWQGLVYSGAIATLIAFGDNIKGAIAAGPGPLANSSVTMIPESMRSSVLENSAPTQAAIKPAQTGPPAVSADLPYQMPGLLIDQQTATVRPDNYVFAKGRHGKQQRLRDAGSDVKEGRSVRGWIKQEQNSIARGKRTSIRVPPGKNLAHERGKEAAKGFGYEDSKVQDIDLHKTQHRVERTTRQ